MSKLNLSEAAKQVLSGISEDSKSNFDANIAAKRSQRTGDYHAKGAVGQDKLNAAVAYGEKEAGLIGQSPEKSTEELPDYLRGTPRATPPGATPPVGSEKDGVGATHPKGQPQETQGRSDLLSVKKQDATDYESIRDRRKASMPAQTFHPNPGAPTLHVPEDVEYDDEEVIAEEEARKAAMHARMKEKMKEDIAALLDGEDLSEEFVQKATTIFEAAVIARAEEIVASVEEELTEQFEIAIEEVKEELAGKIDDYMNYMAEEWMEENKLAVEQGIRTEIVEDFISGLRDLFTEHYIDIPEDKVDVVEELAGKVEELEEELNETINAAVQMRKELNEHRKYEAIYTACEGLTQTQVEKLKSLAEGVEFTTGDEFVDKLETLKESYFKSTVVSADKSALDDEVLIEEEVRKPVGEDPAISQYAKAISQTLKV